MTTALADCAKHHVAISRDQLKRKLSDWECPYCRLTRLVEGLGDLSDDLKECCELEIRGAAGDLLKNTRRELQALIKEARGE